MVDSMDRREPVIEVVDDDMAEVLRRKTGAQRLKIIDALYRTAWQLAESNIRSRHPDWSPLQIQRAVAQRIAGGTD